MAFIEIDSIDPVNHATFYNLDEAVGYGCTNYEEDVKVVQFFLKRLYNIPIHRHLKPWGQMVVDGKVGPITHSWIRKYQIDCIDNGVDAVVDGIVNRAGNHIDNFKGSISHTIYTIRMLNIMLRKQDTAVYKNLTTSPEVPPEMRLIFLKIQASGPPMNYASNN